MSFREMFDWAFFVCFAFAAILATWAWYRRGFWLPWYVHLVAFGAFLAGIGINQLLPDPTTPNLFVLAIWPLIFPVVGCAGAYCAGILMTWAASFRRPPIDPDPLPRKLVRIIATPPGEAPEEVRRAWIGLVLPLVPGDKAPRHLRPGFAALWWRSKGLHYFVLVDEAISILDAAAPDAAAWWKKKVPDLIGSGQAFAFAVAICELVD